MSVDLHTKIKRCRSCDLHATCNAPVPGNGYHSPVVMLVGEAPGQYEDEKGLPFQGQAGQLLNDMLISIGYPREACYVSNVVKCRPPNNKLNPKFVPKCGNWLVQEIMEVKPKIVVAMGATAINYLMKDKAGTVEHLHGKPVLGGWGYGFDFIILPTYHPAAALHETSKLRQLFDDFQVLGGLLSGDDPSDYIAQDKYPNPIYRNIEDLKQLTDLMVLIGKTKLCAADVETVDGKLWSVQISIKEGEAYFINRRMFQPFKFPP